MSASLDRRLQEGGVELDRVLGVDVGVPLLLVGLAGLAAVGLGRRVVAAVVVDEVGRVGGHQRGAPAAIRRRDVLGLGRIAAEQAMRRRAARGRRAA